MIFGMCNNIWVIRRRNVTYLYNKKSHLVNFFAVKVSGYDVIRCMNCKLVFLCSLICTKNSPNDIYRVYKKKGDL